MTAFQGAVDSTFAAFGIDAVCTPAGGEPVAVRVIASRPDTIVGFAETRIHAETATFERRARARAPAISSPSAARASSSRASPSGAIPTGSCGQLMCGRPKRLGAQVGLFRPSRTNPAIAATTPIPKRIQYSATGAPPDGAPASGAGAAAMNRT
jgi:hypothetical protein